MLGTIVYNSIMAVLIFLSSIAYVVSIFRAKRLEAFRDSFLWIKLSYIVVAGLYSVVYISTIYGIKVSVQNQILVTSMLLTTVFLSNIASLLRNGYLRIIRYKPICK